MASTTTCCLGIDGLPYGTHVVVATDGVVAASFDVLDDGGRAVDLESRVVEAVERAHRLVGAEVEEVRLVCIDDGAHGQRIGRIGDRLVDAGVRFQVLDLVTSPSDVAPKTDCDPSLARARGAALW